MNAGRTLPGPTGPAGSLLCHVERRRLRGGLELKSALTGIPWPAVPSPAAAVLLGMLHELDSTQWLPLTELARRQDQALDGLVAHARSTVPYYRNRPEYAEGRPWTELPILTREQVEGAGDALVSADIPADHLPLGATRGTTRVTTLMAMVCALREHRWHRRDPSASIVTLRPDPSGQIPPQGLVLPSWGAPVDTVYDTGSLAVMAVDEDVAVQARWLAAHDPAYVLSLPSNLLALCRHFVRTGTTLPSLREVRSYGEVLVPEVRDACHEVWGVPVTDVFTSPQLGYLALQCPTGERYHLMSELVRVEVLDDGGHPCPPGVTGRVVVTSLHNYAMPLLRYDVGDDARVGEPCPCGRGLPVLDRIVGRSPTPAVP